MKIGTDTFGQLARVALVCLLSLMTLGCTTEKTTLPVPAFSVTDVFESADEQTRQAIREKAKSKFISYMDYWGTVATHIQDDTFGFTHRSSIGEVPIGAGKPREGTYDVGTMRIDRVVKETFIDVTAYKVYFDKPNRWHINIFTQSGMLEFVESCEILGVQINR